LQTRTIEWFSVIRKEKNRQKNKSLSTTIDKFRCYSLLKIKFCADQKHKKSFIRKLSTLDKSEDGLFKR